MASTRFKLPLPAKGPITSGFGYRKAPNKLASTFHQGVDIGVPVGTPVYAPMDGVATIEPFSVKGGNVLAIKHNANLTTKYLHLSNYNVASGQSVKQGDIVAYSGQTGNVTGPHLHWIVIYNGKKVDPLSFLEDPVPVGDSTISHQQDEPNIVSNKKEYTDFITINDQYITTLQQFVDKYQLAITDVDLLNFKTNKDRILKAYTKEQKRVNNNTANKDVVNIGTIIEVPLNKMKNNNPYKVNQTLSENKSYNAFIEYEIKKLLNNPDYIKVNALNKNSIKLDGNLYKGNLSVSVWLWSKTLSLDGGFLIDISKFVKNIIMNVAEEGGNFNIKLPHITYKRVNDGHDFDLDINFYEHHKIQNFVSLNGTHTQEHFQYNAGQTIEIFKRKNSFFNDVISENDILFIRLEPLKMDDVDYKLDGDLIKINPNQLPGKVFDMIALVDNVVINSDGKSGSQEVNINGRDLMKMVLDDSVYFFPIQYAVQNPEQIIKNSSSQKSAKRLTLPDATSGNQNFQLDTGIVPDVRFNFDATQTIEDWLVFIFSQLTNLDICPDSLLQFYKDKTFIVSRSDSFDSQGSYGYKRILANGLWQIIKLVVDNEVANRKLADSSLATDTGSLLNMIRKVAQKPFVEFDSDTFGDKFYFKVRKPPFAQQAYKGNYTIDIFEDDVYGDNLQYSNEVYTFYRLVPMGSLIDASDGATMTILPAVLFPQYAEIWGNKVLDVQSNFLDFDFSVTQETASNLDNIISQGRQDLDWLIETNCYLPFTRTGNIIIKGDRRIKRGINIRYMPTGEIFYVDGVNNVSMFDSAVQRTTTLTVSRGMVEKHYDKYFQLVRLLRNDPVMINEKLKQDTWTVNNDVFQFFLQRKQWI